MRVFNRIEKKEHGITLLIAIVIASVVLSLGLSIASITTRSFVLSTAVRESQLAYYAGEAGSECARYWSLLDRKNFTPETPFTISCNEESFSWDSNHASSVFEFSFGHDYEIGPQTFQYPYFSVVRVERQPGIFHLDIDSKGYNTDELNALRKYERQQNLQAYGICSYRPDIMFVLDLSSSVQADDLAFIKSALTQFVNTLNPSETGVHLGIVQFGSRANMITHLTGDKAQILSGIENDLFQYGLYEDYTNLAAGIQFARAELGNQQVPTENWLYCPLAGGPDRVVVQFPHNVKTSIGVNDSLGGGGHYKTASTPLPEIPPGEYNIYVATCDGFGTSGFDRGSTSIFERGRLNLYTDSAMSGSPFFSSNLTTDVPDYVSYGQSVTLVNENQTISQTARGFQMEHCPTSDDNPATCPVVGGPSFLALCAAFETADGSPISTTAPNNYNYTSTYDRPDNESPDYIIVITDGGSTQYYSCMRQDFDGNNLFNDADHRPGQSNQEYNMTPRDVGTDTPQGLARRQIAMGKAVVEADAARSAGIDIFAIGINIPSVQADCPGYINCGEHINDDIASFAAPDSPDVDGNAFYFEAPDYDDLDTVLSQIVNCVHPLSGD
ncbi:MAG: VWA domain-containing protein [Patescibacteria group bacterium]|nr:VWA domain-containing protein [bacterium]MDZ4240900.1 VWA domain-containing protein [Patescibacteria group bacterium]